MIGTKRFTLRARLAAIALGLALALPAAAGAAQVRLEMKAGGKIRFMTLKEAVILALRNNPEVKEAKAQVDIYRAKRAQADAARWPQIEILGVVGPVPAARGNQIFSPDKTDGNTSIGIFQSAKLQAIQPLYTFGLIDGLRTAARNGVRVHLEGVRLKKADIVLKVNEYYYGVVTAREVRDFLIDTRGTLMKARAKLVELIEEEKGEEIDLYKLDAFSGELEKGLNEADKNSSLALEALRFATGLPSGARIDVVDKRIVPDPRPVQDLPVYKEMSLRLRPEIEQIASGLKAREALVKVERSQYWPQIFVAVIGSAANADNRSTIRNPFIFDQFNHEFISAVAGFKWSINFGITKGRVAEAEAELLKLEYTRQKARKGIPVQVQKAFLELMEARKNIIATEKSYRAGRKWMIAAGANFDLGLGEPKEIFEALGQYVKMRVANLQALYNHNLSLARLEHASGSLVPKGAKPIGGESEK
ncbi:MAG: TolC family protein [bacterium]